jgi:NADP-dependent 3-hydroxy acid dehydrogenase YdfG
VSNSGSGSRLAILTGGIVRYRRGSGAGARWGRIHRGSGARREGRIKKLADETGAHARVLDVTDRDSVSSFAGWTEPLGGASVMVNNAGGARDLEPIAEMDEEHWRWMFETNVLGVGLMTRALLPQLRNSGNGPVVVIGSAYRLGGGGRGVRGRLGL